MGVRYVLKRMSSPKPATAGPRAALEPQRRPGKLRVAALLRAGAEVIAERGYEAATMAEIAARADAPIGSLYRFFPNKESLADAIIDRYSELINTAFERINTLPASTTTQAFADALLASLAELRGETPAVGTLLETRPDASARRSEFHDAFLKNIIRVLKRRDPRLENVEDIAVVLLQNLKMMKSLHLEHDAGAITELRNMTRLYLESKLGK